MWPWSMIWDGEVETKWRTFSDSDEPKNDVVFVKPSAAFFPDLEFTFDDLDNSEKIINKNHGNYTPRVCKHGESFCY